jgi:hypothetical protein
MLVNSHHSTLTAWAVDLIDSGGRPIARYVSDHIDLASEFLPARTERPVEVGWVSRGEGPQPKPVALVFRAGIDINGFGVGDSQTVAQMHEWRAQRQTAQPAEKTTIE